MQFDTEIDAEDEQRQVKTYTHTVTPGDLFVELIPVKHTPGLRVILADRPDVSCVQEGRQLQERQHLKAVLEVHIQFDIAHLQVIDDRTVDPRKSTGSQRSCLPAADTIRTTRKIAFLKRDHVCIQVGQRHTQPQVGHQTMLGVEDTVAGEVDVPLSVLRERDPPEHLVSRLVCREVHHLTQCIERVAGRLTS